MNKDLFSKNYGFHSYEEMLSESGAEKDKDGTLKFITPLAVDWIVWVDSFPEIPKVFTFANLLEAKKHINTFTLREEATEKNGLSNLIQSYEGKISETNVAGLKRAYEVNKDMLQRLQQVTKNIFNGNR